MWRVGVASFFQTGFKHMERPRSELRLDKLNSTSLTTPTFEDNENTLTQSPDSMEFNSRNRNLNSSKNNKCSSIWAKIFPCLFQPSDDIEMIENLNSTRIPWTSTGKTSNVYDSAMTCLCFQCPKCAAAMSKSKIDEKLEDFEPLEFVSEYLS